MQAVSEAPRLVFEAAVAQSLFSRISRLGPTVPVAPAAASVWHEAHPADANTVFPAAAVEPPDEDDAPEVELLELDEDEAELLELDAAELELDVLAAPGTPG